MDFNIAFWLLATVGLAASIYFWHKKKTTQAERVGSTDDFSNITLFFDPVKGEGHLFLGGILVIVLTSLFFVELAKVLVGIFFN